MCMHTCVHVKAKSWVVFLRNHPPCFLRLSHWPGTNKRIKHGWLASVPRYPPPVCASRTWILYVDSRDQTRILMLLQQILYHQLSHLPRSNKSFQKYTGSSPILKRNIFVYDIRRRKKKSRLRVGCKLPLQQNLPLLALQLPTSPALALKAGVLSVTFSSVYGRKLGSAFLTWFMTKHIQFFLSWARMCREQSNSSPVAHNVTFPQSSMEERGLTKLFSTDSDTHALKEMREDVEFTE